MNIDFIKWMCEKAELETKVNDIEYTEFKICGSTFAVEHLSKESLVYALLLQRAIEGVEEKTGKISYIYCSKNIVFEGYTWKWDNLGQSGHSSRKQAKEQALKYIYEQERGKV